MIVQKAKGQPNIRFAATLGQGGVVIRAVEVVEPRGTDESLLHHQCLPDQVILCYQLLPHLKNIRFGG